MASPPPPSSNFVFVDDGVSLVTRTRLRKDISREGVMLVLDPTREELSGLYSPPSPAPGSDSDSEAAFCDMLLVY